VPHPKPDSVHGQDPTLDGNFCGEYWNLVALRRFQQKASHRRAGPCIVGGKGAVRRTQNCAAASWSQAGWHRQSPA
jgi:hypothetical protein